MKSQRFKMDVSEWSHFHYEAFLRKLINSLELTVFFLFFNPSISAVQFSYRESSICEITSKVIKSKKVILSKSSFLVNMKFIDKKLFSKCSQLILPEVIERRSLLFTGESVFWRVALFVRCALAAIELQKR